MEDTIRERCMEKGVLYVATGAKYVDEARQSTSSLKEHTPHLPVALVTDLALEPDELFEQIIPLADPTYHYSDKIIGIRFSPYEHTLFLDTDTLVCGDVTEMFQLLERFDIAASHHPLALRRATPVPPNIPSSFQLYHTAVVLFKKSAAVDSCLRRWYDIYQEQSQIHQVYDEPAFTEAVYHSNLRIATLPTKYHIQKMGYLHDSVRIIHGRQNVHLMRDMLNKYPTESRIFIRIDQSPTHKNSVVHDIIRSGDTEIHVLFRRRSEHLSRRLRRSIRERGIVGTLIRALGRILGQRP